MPDLNDNLNATDADRLKRLYKQWKDHDRSHNQDVAAKILGISQSAVSQYVLGKIALNLGIASKFAGLFSCDIEDISPSLADELKEIIKTHDSEGVRGNRIPIRYIGTMGPNDEIQLSAPEEDNLRVTALKWLIDDDTYAIQIKGDSLSPAIRNGWYVVVSKPGLNQHGEFMIVKLADGRHLLKEFLFGMDIDPVVTEPILGGERASFDPDEIEQILPIAMILPPSAKART